MLLHAQFRNGFQNKKIRTISWPVYSLLLAQFCNCFQNKKSKIIIDQFIYSHMLNSAILFRTKKCQKNSLTCLFTPTGPILQWFSEQKIKKIHRPFFTPNLHAQFCNGFQNKKQIKLIDFLDLFIYSFCYFCNCFQNKKSEKFTDQFIYTYLPNSAMVLRTRN